MTVTKLRKQIDTLEKQLENHKEEKSLHIQKSILEHKISVFHKKKYSWKTEASSIKKLSLEGKTLQEIGDIYGVSRQMIKQVLFKYFPSLSQELHGLTLLREEKRKHYLASLYARTGRYTGKHPTDLSRAMSRMFSRKKQNAKKSKWEWLITPPDLVYPLVCTMLGLELDWFAEYRAENSPSIDRIDSTKGYIPGNVLICSWRANRIKNDGTASELRKIADFLDKHHTTTIDTQVVSVVQ